MEAIASMPVYENYKITNNQWLGQIPEHWQLKKFKYLAAVKKGKLPKRMTTEESLNFPPYLSMEYLRGGIASQFVMDKDCEVVNDGDILLLWDGSNSGEFIRSKKGVISSTVATIKFNNINNSFAWYASSIVEGLLRSSTVGMGIPHVDGDELKNSLVAVPTEQEQTAIANFLDKKTAQIDEAIAIKEKQIELLNERKQIIIQKAVTQGIDPNAPMKDSSVYWIGYIPEHWEVRRSKFLFTQRKERAWKTDVQLSATQAYGVIPQSEYEALSGNTVVKIQFHLDKRKHVEKDDFVISMRSFQGGLERAWSSGCIRSSYVVLKPLEEINPDFYGYLLKLPSYIKALQRTGNFIRDGQDLNFDNFSQVDLFIPPLEEQKAIAEYVKEFMVSSDKGIELLQQQIEKLKEYKTTLINSAVTGKIKVPGVIEG